MRGNNHVTFGNLAKSPARHDVGDAAPLLDSADDDFCYQPSAAADQQFAVSLRPLLFAKAKDNEFPLRIYHENLPACSWGQRNDVIRTRKPDQLSGFLVEIALQNLLLLR